MSNRKETPAYASPALEPYKADRMQIHQEVRAEIAELSCHEIDSFVATKVLSLRIRKSYFSMLTPDTTVEQRKVFAVGAITTDRAESLEEKESKRRIRLLSDSAEREVIAIGPGDVLPEQPRSITPFPIETKAFGEIDIGADPDETIPAPAFPVPDTPRVKTLPPSFRPPYEPKKTITIPPPEADPMFPHAKTTYPKQTPIEFLPKNKTLLPKTSYSFILDLEAKKGKDKR